MKKLLALSALFLLFTIALPAPLLAHGGMVGFGEGFLVCCYLFVAFISTVLILLLPSPLKAVIMMFNGILFFFALTLLFRCLEAGFRIDLDVAAAVWFAANIGLGFIIIHLEDKSSADNTNTEETANPDGKKEETPSKTTAENNTKE